MDAQGRIVFRQRGLITTYECTCAHPNAEPSEVGVHCYNCGARGEWPR